MIRPTCLALILCDTVIEDARTRNKSLINMFNGILTPAVPVRHDKLCAFTAFVGGRGDVPITLRLCYDQEYDNDLLRLSNQVSFPSNPNAVVDMVFEIRGLPFPNFGGYTFEILCDGAILGMRRFTVTESAQSSPTPPPDNG